ITIQDNTTVPQVVGTLLQYKRSGTGNVIIAYAGGVTGTAVQTYSLNDVITLRKTATNTWEALNPPQDLSGLRLTNQTVGGSNGNAVYLSGSETWSQTDADAEATSKSAIGIRISATEVLLQGVYIT